MRFCNYTEYNAHQIFCAGLDAGNKQIVIFCHGYRGSSIGPARHFVTISEELAKNGISSLRFDQYGSGNSAGDFMFSSFDDWVTTTREIAESYLKRGYRVSLFGQSMGGSTVIMAASSLPALTSFVAWVPDPSIETFIPPREGYIEEAGQRVQSAFWQEAHDAGIAEALAATKPAGLIIQCGNDEYVSAENHQAIQANAGPQHTVEMLEGYVHSSWSYEQAQSVIATSVDFLMQQFQ